MQPIITLLSPMMRSGVGERSLSNPALASTLHDLFGGVSVYKYL
jgi:hypothetical protein